MITLFFFLNPLFFLFISFMSFQLNQRLDQGGHLMGEIENCLILLKNNSHYVWMILVPKVSAAKEDITDLNTEEWESMNLATKQVAAFIQSYFSPDKINIGNIGNSVRQMHIHVVGRFESDPAWPGVVWGAEEKRAYDEEVVHSIKSAFLTYFAS